MFLKKILFENADFEHPVAGNRRFGIYSDPDRPGEFVFYTMGVDRIWDRGFDLFPMVRVRTNQYLNQ